MSNHTYIAGRDLTIQSRQIPAGTVIGKGDVEAGNFTAAEGLERHVSISHVRPRLIDGRIIIARAKADTKAPPPNDDSTPDQEAPVGKDKSKSKSKSK